LKRQQRKNLILPSKNPIFRSVFGPPTWYSGSSCSSSSYQGVSVQKLVALYSIVQRPTTGVLIRCVCLTTVFSVVVPSQEISDQSCNL
jgi:hypothetical protein